MFDISLHQRPPLGHPANGHHSTFSPKQSIRLRGRLSWSPPRHRRKAAPVALLEPCQPQPPVPSRTSAGHWDHPHHSKAAALLAGSSTCMDARRSCKLHRLTNLPPLEVQWEIRNHHPLKQMLFELIWTCLAAQLPSLPKTGLLSII